ncbi:MAG: DegT/DnrJ/EryC1/StrS family aminotransferase [Chitinispirillia bacterium]|jgi:dTDP-4-amino-4,6-dideoxygalactose transaminase
MNVPFLDLKMQYNSIRDEINPAIQNILDSCSYILGNSVSDFEQEFAKLHNGKYCYGLASGTAGNHVVLWTLGVGPGDEVIIPANTFIATAWGATLCGAQPVFVDCHPDSYNIDPDKVENAISSRTKAIVAVHLYGQAADMDALEDIAQRHNIHLVEDCAQAHISEYKGKKIGSLSIASSFSFYPGKNLGAYGEGGAVMTNDNNIAKKLKCIRAHGAEEKYTHTIFGHNYRMDGIQGAVLKVKLKHLQSWTEKRRKAAAKYKELLFEIKEVQTPVEMPYNKHVYHLFVIQTPKRDLLQAYLNENKISTGIHYPIPLHLQPCFNHLGYRKGDFPISEKLADNCISLPLFPEITEEQIQYVCSTISEFFKRQFYN